MPKPLTEEPFDDDYSCPQNLIKSCGPLYDAVTPLVELCKGHPTEFVIRTAIELAMALAIRAGEEKQRKATLYNAVAADMDEAVAALRRQAMSGLPLRLGTPGPDIAK